MEHLVTRITAPRPTRGKAPSHSPPDTLYAPGYNLARKLGWLSIGLGLAELVAPRTIATLTGVRSCSLLRAYGARELACGLAILRSPRPVGWLWARVAGDALDLVTLLSSASNPRRRTLVSALAVGGITALDSACAAQMSAAAALEG